MVDREGRREDELSRHHASRQGPCFPGATKEAAAILIATLLLWIAPGNLWAVQFHGTVTDAETRQPIAGATVVVMWRKRPYLAMDGPEYLHKIREVVTDAQGYFSIDGSPGIDWNPLTHVEWPPDVIIYAVGFHPLARSFLAKFGYVRDEDLLAALERGTTVALPRLVAGEAAEDATGIGSLGIWKDVPLDRVPNLVRLVNEQRRRLGLRSLISDEEPKGH